jgi:hypothetical protein
MVYCFVPHANYMSRPFHSPKFNQPNKIQWVVQKKKFMIMYVTPSISFCLLAPYSEALLVY